MAQETVTIEIDVSTAAILRALEEKATREGITLDALLQRLIKENNTIKESASATRRRDFMKLPLEVRRQIMKSQAEQLTDEYAHPDDRQVWQGGDFVES